MFCFSQFIQVANVPDQGSGSTKPLKVSPPIPAMKSCDFWRKQMKSEKVFADIYGI
jgi:hypothetical protein